MTSRDSELITKTYESGDEVAEREAFEKVFETSPIPIQDKLRNFGLYLNRRNLTKILLINDLYQRILRVHGSILEFGVRWGQNLSLFTNLRGIYEPYNYNRKVVGFDTWDGFPSVQIEDGTSDIIREGSYRTTRNYDEHLERVLAYHESESPVPHIRKFELVKGDASQTIGPWLENHQEVVIALAYFDFDLYEPTVKCLEAIKPRLAKGSIVVFDELNHPDFPGETRAAMDVFGLNNVKLERSPYSGYQSFLVIE
jgi:hypothetical protein